MFAVPAVCSYRVVLVLDDSSASLCEIVGMVEQIENLRLNLDILLLGDAECPGQAEIDFINPRTVEGVVTLAGDWAGTGNPGGGIACSFVNGSVVDEVSA